MATIRLVPSAYGSSNTRYATISDGEDNMYKNTDTSNSYATLRGRNRNSSTAYSIFIRGFNFDDVPSNATVTSFTVKIRCYRSSNQRTGSSFYLRLANDTTTLSNTTTSTNIDTSFDVITIPTGNLTWSNITGYGSDFGIQVPLASTSSSYPYVYVSGAEILVEYTLPTAAVTGVTVSPTTATIEIGESTTLTATVQPSDAANTNVTWSTSNSSIATVSGGVVTGQSAGTATITVTTEQSGYTATCLVTVQQAVTYDYVLTSSMQVGKKYLITNGNSGTVYLLTNQADGSRQLDTIQATVSNNRITINSNTKSKAEFECVRYTSGNDITITVKSDNKYLYTDNSTGLRMNAPSTLDRFWHYQNNKFWQFKSTSSNGYSDTSSEYKYYLQLNNSNNYTDAHVSTTSIESSSLPLIYIYVEDDGSVQAQDVAYIKVNGAWTQVSSVYKKINGSWVLQTDLSNVFGANTNYIKG